MRYFPRAASQIVLCTLLCVPVSFVGAEAQTAQQPLPEAAPALDSTAVPSPQPPIENSVLPARISEVEGAVRLNLPSQGGEGAAAPNGAAPGTSADASLNMPVPVGAEVETGNDGRAELEFSDGTIARVAPNSVAKVVAQTIRSTTVAFQRGLSYLEVPTQGGVTVTLMVGPDQFVLAQNTLLRVDLDNNPLQVAVLRGSAHVTSPGTDIGFDAPSGDTAVIDANAPDSYDLRQSIAENSWDQWNSDRDNQLAQMAEGQTNVRVGSGDAESPAWNDLDYYGTWYNVPGAGQAWAPDGVDASFDPYGSGAWGYYSGVGPVWISSYPWGWLPYHCGAWNYFNGFGWGWQPAGGCGLYGGAGWLPYAGIHNAPNGFHLPLRTVRQGGLHPPLHPLPRALPLVRVQRGPDYQFRSVGGTRPEPRAFALAERDTYEGGAAYASTVPRSGGFSGGAGSAYAGASAFAGNGRAGYTAHTPGVGTPTGFQSPRILATPPSVLPAPRSVYTAPPHYAAPPAPVHAAAPAAPAAHH